MSHQNHSGSLRQGLVIFIVLAFLTFVEFFIAITNQSLLLLAVAAFIKAGLVLYYYMHIYKLVEADTETDQHSYAWKLSTNRMGFWLFILSDAFLFAGLFVTRFNLLGLIRPDLNQYLGLLVTGVLLISSFFMNRAETQMAQGNQKGFLISTAITMFLGIGFLAGVLGVEWRDAPFSASDSAASAVFFMMTGMHAFHVLTGVIFLGIVLNNGRRGLYSAENHWAVEAATVYWHFIDVVWIFFYPALYLIGRLA
ncbi:MAG: cytochrome c oxidase subunit 3 [Chloroflexi bacterium]|nr:cytochrome c oxidase subunit 3 [Chloroflexota bacterium]